MKSNFTFRSLAGAILPFSFAVLSTAASAQIDPANRALLMARGYNKLDFKAAETTQIGSNYPLYSKWLSCMRDGGGLVLINPAVRLFLGDCNDETLTLRASIARSLGLSEATRVVALLTTDYVMRLRRATNAQQTSASESSQKAGTSKIFWHDGLWTVQVSKDNKCDAYKSLGYKNEDGREGLELMIALRDGSYELRLVIGHRSRLSNFSEFMGKSLRLESVIVSGSAAYGKSDIKTVLKYDVLTNDYDVYLVTPLQQPVFSNLEQGDRLQITTTALRSVGTIAPETGFSIGDLSFVLPQIARCNSKAGN